MNRPIIAIDIDDVLAKSAKSFVEYSNKKYGTSLTVNDYDDNWANLWKIDTKELELRAKQYHSGEILKTYEHDESAYRVLKKLQLNYELLILTSRRAEARELTIDWLHEKYEKIFEKDRVHFAGIWDSINDGSIHRTKTGLANELGADYLVDDQLKYCLSFAKTGKNAILFGDYAWNQAKSLPENVTRRKNWLEVERYFFENDGI